MPEAAGKTGQRGRGLDLSVALMFQRRRDAKQIIGIVGPLGCMQGPRGLLWEALGVLAAGV